MIRIDLFYDGNYPRGVTYTYLLDGYKSKVLTYVTKLHEDEVLIRKSIDFNNKALLESIEYYRTSIISWIKITSSCGKFIEVGERRLGDQHIYKVPKDCIPYGMIGCVQGRYPFPNILLIQIKVKNEITG